MEVQYNVVDAATLRKAQAKPDEHHNLVVRIAGFSAYFVDMTPAMQEDIISRAEHCF
jgi:formate C-acetyltransferase